MNILVLLLFFVSVFFSLGISSKEYTVKNLILTNILFFSLIVVLITELASYFYQLNFFSISLSWWSLTAVNCVYLFFKRDTLGLFISDLKFRIKNTLTGLNAVDKSLLTIAFSLLALIFVQGLIYPPNNFDSMTYHLPRIINWISHQSVEHFQTSNTRHLYQPPFAEFIILHFNVLNNGDYFSNSVQFLFLLASLVVLLAILEFFGLNRRFKIWLILLTITIPQVILQASSTKNDIVVSFFILLTFYLILNISQRQKITDWIKLGLAVGFALLTKGTAYVYLAPLLVFLSIITLLQLYKIRAYSLIAYGVLAVGLCLFINSAHFSRNYRLNKNILGVEKEEAKMYSNQAMSPALLFSNLLKNAGLHTGPFPISKVAEIIILKIHSIIGVDVNNPNTNFLGTKYDRVANHPTYEDSSPNGLHFLLISLTFLILLIDTVKTKNYTTASSYTILLIAQIVLFCWYLKWQIWHTRLHIPFFMLSMPLSCYAINLSRRYVKIFEKVIFLFIGYGFLVIMCNYSRPFVQNSFTAEISVGDERYKKYFSNNPSLYQEYKQILVKINLYKNKRIGLIFSGDGWEYPLFCQFYGKGILPIYLDVNNTSRSIPRLSGQLDCIISSSVSDSVIVRNNQVFYNCTPGNTKVWFFQKITSFKPKL